MDIGYFRFKDDNINTRRLNAMAHRFYGLNLVVFGPEDINYEEKMVRGTYFNHDGWKRRTVPLPKIINNMVFRSYSDKKLYHFLSSNSLLLFHSFGDKEYIEKKLKDNNLLNELIIPSKVLSPSSDVQEILKMVQFYKKLVFKPVNGRKGKGIFMISKQQNVYLYEDQENDQLFNEKQMNEFFEKLKRKFVVQKYVESKTPNGLPFDIRVHFEKNGKGNWVKVQTYARVGISNMIVSNIAKGGSVIRARLFLRSMYGEDKGRRLYQKLNEQLEGFPSQFEKLYDFNISTIAVDLGLENDDFYLFEVNSFPGGTFARGEVAMLRAAHVKYLSEKLYSNTEVAATDYDIMKENKRLKEENSKLIKELNKIRNSRSWKYTSIFRRS